MDGKCFYCNKSYNLQNIHFGTLYVWGCTIISGLDFFLIFVPFNPAMYRTIITFLIISLLPAFCLSQEYQQTESESPLYEQVFPSDAQQKHIRLLHEPKLDETLMIFIEQNRKLNGIPCYWIRIFSGSAHDAREKAYETKARFMSKFEGIRNNVIYDNPNFKVYIGGYRSKSETLKLLRKVKRDFPTAFIVYDIIDFPEKHPGNQRE
jgi:hypothetical protein